MATGPSLYLGKTGATGGVTGAHGHFEVIKDGKRYGLSQARSDIGQNIQFRLPGSQDWQQMYRQREAGKFELNPGVALTEGIGVRETHPVTGAKNVAHQGEDYSFPEGTDLRFMGGGNVQGIPNVGRAGNISALHTGPYRLDVFHMSKLPDAASAAMSTQGPSIPALPTSTTQATTDTRTKDILEAFLYGVGAQKPKTPEPSFANKLVTGLMQSALAPQPNFLSNYIKQEPYIQGQGASTNDYLYGLL